MSGAMSDFLYSGLGTYMDKYICIFLENQILAHQNLTVRIMAALPPVIA
jgi:hypothetical protein